MGHGDDRFGGGVDVLSAGEGELEGIAFFGDLDMLEEVIVRGDGDVIGRGVDDFDIEAVTGLDAGEIGAGKVPGLKLPGAFDQALAAGEREGGKQRYR